MFIDEDGRLDALMKLPALKGAALAIFIALLIAEKALTREELVIYTGWGKDAITDGLKRLGVLRAVIDQGRYSGWVLAPNWRQLPLPILYLAGESGELPTTKAEKPPSPVTRVPLLTTTTTTFDHEEAVVVTREAKAEKSPSPLEPVDNSIREWLTKGGIGPDSPKMHHLLSLNFDPVYVKAHVLDRLAAIREGNGRFGVGMLIKKLEDGDPAPPLRCETCLQTKCKCDNICQSCGGDIDPQIGWCLQCSGLINR